MKKKIIISVVVLVVTAVAVFLYFKFNKKVQVVTFTTAQSQVGYIAKTITATGSIQPVDTVAVGAQVSGVVKMVYVDFNSVVQQGQLIAKVDPTIAAAQVVQSAANLATAKSNRTLQKNNFDRQDKLYKLGAISKADYQIAVNEYNNSRSTVDNIAAQLTLAKKNLSYTDIYSPISGVVLNRNVSEGQTIASSFSSPTLFTIAKDLSKMQVRANVDEADIGGVKVGQNATFTVDAFPNDVFEGTVKEVLLRASVSSSVVTYATLINVDNKDLRLKPSMTASINIYIEEDSTALLIPSQALVFKPDSTILKGFKIKRLEAQTAIATNVNKVKNTLPRDSTHKINADNAEITKSTIWVKNGDTLNERRILTTLNDNISVKVIKGLSINEEVIMSAVASDSKNGSKTPTTVQSPFMPKMTRRPAGRARN